MPFYNFGLEGYVGLALYAVAVLAFYVSIFRRPLIGICFLVPLLPLQTIRYRLNGFLLGESIVYLMLVAVAIGLLRQGKRVVPKTPLTVALLVYVVFTFASMCYGSAYMGLSAPLPGDPRFADWLSYMVMPAMFFLVAASVEDMRDIKMVLVLMALATLQLDRSFYSSVSGRDYSSYSDDLRQTLSAGGSMGYAGVNGLAAYSAQAATFLLAMAAFTKRFWLRLGYHALAFYSALCLMYSFSRGGYVAFIMGWVFLGLVKRRLLLVLLIVFAAVWTSVVPNAVVERVQMTRNEDGSLDHSAQLRIQIWEDAMELIRANRVFGTGFNTYAYMGRVGSYRDTHNYYLKILLETGLIGMFLFLWVQLKAFGSAWTLFRKGNDPILSGIGLGFAGWVLCAAVSNAFGDRWTYLQIQGYFWVIAGLVARGLALREAVAAEEKETAPQTPGEGQEMGEAVPAPAALT